MDLKWWLIAAIGSACLVAVVVLAATLPMTAARERLRRLANVPRLTRLPNTRNLPGCGRFRRS